MLELWGSRGHHSTFSSWGSWVTAATLSCTFCHSVHLWHPPAHQTGPVETRHHLILLKRSPMDSFTFAAALILRKCFVLLERHPAASLTLTRILLSSIISSLIYPSFSLMNSANRPSFPPFLSNPTFFKSYMYLVEKTWMSNREKEWIRILPPGGNRFNIWSLCSQAFYVGWPGANRLISLRFSTVICETGEMTYLIKSNMPPFVRITFIATEKEKKHTAN